MAAPLAPECPQTRLGTSRSPPAGPHEQARLRLRMTSEAPGQPGPSLKHGIQTRMYLTGAGR